LLQLFSGRQGRGVAPPPVKSVTPAVTQAFGAASAGIPSAISTVLSPGMVPRVAGPIGGVEGARRAVARDGEGCY
jgi:hypothetical protein